MTRDALEAEILDWMAGGSGAAPDPERFERLALALFAFQFEACAPYARLCASLGRSPDRVSRVEEIPAVPTGAFKRLVCAASGRLLLFNAFNDELQVVDVPLGAKHGDLCYAHLCSRSLFVIIHTAEVQRSVDDVEEELCTRGFAALARDRARPIGADVDLSLRVRLSLRLGVIEGHHVRHRRVI